ncbi:MAG: hypothetical protein F4X92_10270 [Gammaproteobacteria bacterium]|nr:hypothetical protein [Gammaproteobacteria bacterium]
MREENPFTNGTPLLFSTVLVPVIAPLVTLATGMIDDGVVALMAVQEGETAALFGDSRKGSHQKPEHDKNC